MRHMRLVTVCVAIVCTIVEYSSSVEPFPYIVPDGYNASLNGDAVFFKCMGPNNTETFFWNVNGMSASVIGGALKNQGIVSSTDVMMENNETYYAVTSIETRAENNNTILQCNYVHSGSVKTSSDIIFRVQGLLEAPTALETERLTSTHNVLRWTDPYTLNLTDILHDISGYTVTVTMEHPPPQHPYDLSVTLEKLNQTVNQTYHISHSDQASFPRYAFPVWLSVSAENPVGQGATSLPLKYTPPTPEGCLRLYDMVSGEFGSEVTLTDTASVSVEIQLFQQPFLNGVDYCFDTVIMVVSVSETVTGSGGGASGESGETRVLVPILSETGVSVVLESDLEEDTHYTATLSFNSHLISTITFSTYAVQDVSIVEVSNGLRVKCSFAEGSSQNTCTVVLVLDGVKQGRESSSGEMTFPDLATGLYTVLVYDSEPGMEGSGRSPALEREVEVSGVITVPTSTTPSVPASPTSDPTATEEPSIEGVTDGGEKNARPSDRSVIKGRTLWIVISVVAVCAVIFLLIVCLLLCKWLRNRSTSYSVQKTEKKAKLERTFSASNPIPDSADVEESISPYSEISRVQQPTTTTAATASDIKRSGVGEYEVVDMEEGREGKRERRDRVHSAALPQQEYTEEELREIRSHTYSTVNKTKGKRQDISPPPPPVPPQNFDPSQEFSDSTESDVKQDLSMAAALQQCTGNHLYDSLQPSTPQCGNAGQAPPPVPAKVSGDPVYESISGPAVGRGRSSNSSPSSSHSPSDDRDDSQLIVPSPPPRTHGVVPDIPYRPLPVSLHNGSRHSVGEGAAISTEDSSIHRPKSMHIQLTSDPEGPRQRDQYYSMGQKLSSMPLLLQYDL